MGKAWVEIDEGVAAQREIGSTTEGRRYLAIQKVIKAERGTE